MKQTESNFEAAKDYLLSRLQEELSPNLFYHGVHHTKDMVLPAFEKFALIEGIVGENLVLGKTAALYHDAGYLVQYAKNEPVGVKIARETLPGFGYTPTQIERIGEIIMATQLQMVDGKFIQVPDRRDLLQMIMCDADLDHLGREDFFVIGENLRREMATMGIGYKTLREWFPIQLAFQQNHSYFTSAAQSLRDEGKQKNIGEMKSLLGLL